MSASAMRREAIKRANSAVRGALPLFEATAPALGYPRELLELAAEISAGKATNRQRNMLAAGIPYAEITPTDGISRADWDLNAGLRFAARRAANEATAEAA